MGRKWLFPVRSVSGSHLRVFTLMRVAEPSGDACADRDSLEEPVDLAA